MYNAAKEEYVYAIAGGETMQIIDYLERAAAQAKKDLILHAESIGIAATPMAGYPNRFEYSMKDPNAPLPEGWVMETNRAGTYLTTDFNSQEGMKARSALSKYTTRMNIQDAFDKLCHSLAPSSYLNNRKYSYESVGDEIVVASPKQYEGDAIVPPGSTVISYAEYVLMQEKANPTPAPQTRVFQKKFSPNG